ncbi:MAG: hypothetical protein ING59_08175 [Burkholderiales bacterium]|jgi:hypothetical protein|nr:hypothetical protein [Burkholderiales bacterium]
MATKIDPDVAKTLLAMVETRNRRDAAIADFKKLRTELTRSRIEGKLRVVPEDILKIDTDHLLSW